MGHYNFSEVEPRWRKYWDDNDVHRAKDGSKKPYYSLDMFPYPSGSGLHVGHWRNYIFSDVWSRFKRLQGYDVMHPMGWDAFGLPAENDAIKKGLHPRTSTEKNIETITEQFRQMGAMYDWSREINTSEPEFYKWTQWIFLQMYKRGLAYRDNAPINWCPSCKTGLANEEVVSGGCERCGTEVNVRDLDQWKLRITLYADRLLDDLAKLDWPEKVKTMQANWIGRSEGAKVVFEAISADQSYTTSLEVFTTRPDTLFGATYMVLAPEHPMVEKLVSEDKREAAESYIAQARQVKEMDRTADSRQKTGVDLGAVAVSPVNGQSIPIWISDYVLMGYGTGAIMAVPAHDTRDFEFATTFDIPIVEVIEVEGAERREDGSLAEASIGEGVMVNSGEFDGMSSLDCQSRITDWLVKEGKGESTVNYKLRDWIFSRQRYWGEPIPIVHCPQCGEVPVPEDDLPVVLPEVEKYQPTGTGESPLAAIDAWVNTACPKCGGSAKRETDTMPQWAGSSWYFLRYPSPNKTDAPFDKEQLKRWMPVHMYIGGVEHAILHLLYARFFTKVLFDGGHIPFDEPFVRLFNQGMITRQSFRDMNRGCENFGFVGNDQIAYESNDPKTPVCARCRQALEVEVSKMSKSKGNVVSPDGLVKEFGTDALRLYELFVGPPEQDAEWTDQGIVGTSRFLSRLWNLVSDNKDSDGEPSLPMLKARHKLIKQVTEGLSEFRFNTTISRFMEFVNFAMSPDGGNGRLDAQSRDDLIVLIGPMAPHIAEELWAISGHEPSMFQSAEWPGYSAELAAEDRVVIAVQVNGKVRATIELSADADARTAEVAALAEPNVQKFLAGGSPKKVIVVPGRIVNVVV